MNMKCLGYGEKDMNWSTRKWVHLYFSVSQSTSTLVQLKYHSHHAPLIYTLICMLTSNRSLSTTTTNVSLKTTKIFEKWDQLSFGAFLDYFWEDIARCEALEFRPLFGIEVQGWWSLAFEPSAKLICMLTWMVSLSLQNNIYKLKITGFCSLNLGISPGRVNKDDFFEFTAKARLKLYSLVTGDIALEIHRSHIYMLTLKAFFFVIRCI